MVQGGFWKLGRDLDLLNKTERDRCKTKSSKKVVKKLAGIGFNAYFWV